MSLINLQVTIVVLTHSVDLLASYNVSEQISSIEDMIAKGADMETVVRLLCLASLTSGGIKTKALENIKREFLQVCSPSFAVHWLLISSS